MTFIWHMSSVQYSKKTIVSGVILKSQPSLKSGSLSMISNAFHTGISYFKQPFANESILIKFDQHIVETLTDSKGRFSISVRDVIENKITILNSSQEKIPFHQNYPVFFKNSNIEQIVISDIDDTIMRSYSQTKVKRLMTTLAIASLSKLVSGRSEAISV